MARFEDASKKKKIHQIYQYDYTIQGQRAFVVSKLSVGVKTKFETIFGKLENRIHAIVTFLSMLELLNQFKIAIVQGEGTNNFWLTLPDETGEDEEWLKLKAQIIIKMSFRFT